MLNVENIEILKRCLNSLTQVILGIKILLLVDKHVIQNQHTLKAMGLFCTEDTKLYLLQLSNHISYMGILMLQILLLGGAACKSKALWDVGISGITTAMYSTFSLCDTSKPPNKCFYDVVGW